MIEIGKNVRTLRLKRQASIQDIADKTGLSISHLSKVERSLVSPSLMSLEKIAEAFNVPVTTLFSNPAGASPVTRQDERAQIMLPSRIVESLSNHTRSFGVYYCTEGEGLDNARRGRAIKDEVNFFSHNGEELIHILEGEMSIKLGVDEYILRPGDSIFFDAGLPHSGRRLTPLVRLLIVTTPSNSITDLEKGLR